MTTVSPLPSPPPGLLGPVEYEGPLCRAAYGSETVCPHDSCWDIIGLGGNSAGQWLSRLMLDIDAHVPLRNPRAEFRGYLRVAIALTIVLVASVLLTLTVFLP